MADQLDLANAIARHCRQNNGAAGFDAASIFVEFPWDRR
jgi:hypothetical protein